MMFSDLFFTYICKTYVNIDHLVPSVRLSTVANHAFPVIATHTWNNLPSDVTSAEPLSTFH